MILILVVEPLFSPGLLFLLLFLPASTSLWRNWTNRSQLNSERQHRMHDRDYAEHAVVDFHSERIDSESIAWVKNFEPSFGSSPLTDALTVYAQNLQLYPSRRWRLDSAVEWWNLGAWGSSSKYGHNLARS
ncbi:hypothetical protein DFH08DRAFT_807016 [Mycena albidolilacea]|uniref:Uncharacterized protein n=1 Tax=Mycena albidolilacea TaxID=1033008 RepID=A0AAD7A576_9AGAR|nr:hypothetical protein DFH08DRAFT_807016 [Mycena albidolilacea]